MKLGITCYPTYGGSGAIATELGIALAERGHEVHFITYRQPFRLPSFLPNVYFHEVDVGRYPLFEYPPYDLALAVRMHEVVRTHGLDILHCHYALPHATSAWIAREMLQENGTDVSVITTLHGTDITIVGQDPSFHAITKFSIEKSDKITAVSQYLKNETFNAFGCTGCNVEVIYNFIDSKTYDRSKYDQRLCEQLGNSRPILMHVSNFRPVKRVTDVIKTFAKVNKAIPSSLVMIGDGPDRAAAEEEVRALKLGQSVHFLGKLEEVAPLLASADVFLLPSQSESFGLSALEALATGVPVVASNTGGLPEVVKHGETGYLCDVGDIDAMSKAAIELLHDKNKWSQFSKAAETDSRQRFSRENIVTQYENLYKQSLNGNHK